MDRLCNAGVDVHVDDGCCPTVGPSRGRVNVPTTWLENFIVCLQTSYTLCSYVVGLFVWCFFFVVVVVIVCFCFFVFLLGFLRKKGQNTKLLVSCD